MSFVKELQLVPEQVILFTVTNCASYIDIEAQFVTVGIIFMIDEYSF